MGQLRRIRDPIHNLISFSADEDDRLLAELVDTRPVQRLRRIKQLGYSEFVYPGATHTRFSHALGAMQMARRMLAAFEKNGVLIGADHETMKRATVAAALLHDVGHGPYSHVFEELAEHVGQKKSHEEYTREIISSQEIGAILKKYDVFQQTTDFFNKESDYTPYSAIISSQMDCDRLDFLARDRYFSGIQSSVIDLSWLFDTLTIEKVTNGEDDTERYSFVVEEKGLRVVEEFVISYMKMYNDVYFHKTTRAVQHMVVDAIKEIIDNYLEAPEFKSNALLAYLASTDGDLDRYSELDDSHIVSIIHAIADGNFGYATELANRYLNRDLYKAIEIPPMADGAVPAQLTKRFKEQLDDAGLWYKVDVIKGKAYKQYDVSDKKFLENIIIKKDGEHLRLHSASRIIKSIDERKARFYFKNESERSAALECLRRARAI